MGFIIFIAIATLIVVAGHAFLYFSWVHFFRVTNPTLLVILRIGLGLGSISFIGASLLVYRFDNFLTSALYFGASIWLGLLLYFFLGVISLWIIAFIGKILGLNFKMTAIAGLIVSAGLILAAIGFINALNPRLRKIEVSIENLPSGWRGRKAVQISDIHLGFIHGKSFMEQIVRKINAADPDIVFITGDLFDGESDKLGILSEPLNDLHPSLGIYFITGNHETYVGIDKTLSALADKKVNILRDQLIEVDGMQILGIDYPQPGVKKDLNQIMAMLDHSKPNIVLFHSPVHVDMFKKMGANLQLSGHTHRGQLWPLNYITNKVYDGYDHGIHRDGSYTLYTSVGTGTWGPPIRTGNCPEITLISFK